jgi:hypothetical protein
MDGLGWFKADENFELFGASTTKKVTITNSGRNIA